MEIEICILGIIKENKLINFYEIYKGSSKVFFNVFRGVRVVIV